ncbi:MAG: class I SAM-dependent methyltransferase [Chloracidobacterium sp.]|nr:class I SAM-dependent methyltransferase [Chloracidobacterium sp.]MDW8217041.1 class I SAM-dependent methyltransferase [Acidobacteriota bacterium]
MSDGAVMSPVVPGVPARLVESLEAARLIESYQRDYGIDVADYFTGLSSVGIYACPVTGYRFYHPFTLAGREDLYAQLARFDWYYTDRPEHALADRYIRPGDKVLEIGCGQGLFLKRLAARGVRATGLDLNTTAVAQCRSDGLDARLETIESHAVTHHQAYDAVCAFHVFEHIVDVRGFLTATLDCLRPGGRLVLAVPNSDAYYAHRFGRHFALNAPPHHMGLWDKKSLKALANCFPLTVEALLGVAEPVSEWENYIVFSTLHSPLLARKRDWLLWRFYQRFPTGRVRSWIEKILVKSGPNHNVIVIYRRR